MRPEEAAPLDASRRIRYVLTLHLLSSEREVELPELVEVATRAGCRFPGRPGKVVSDALRWEVRRGRVVRSGRGRYRAGRMPRSTEWWLRACLAADDAAAA